MQQSILTEDSRTLADSHGQEPEDIGDKLTSVLAARGFKKVLQSDPFELAE